MDSMKLRRGPVFWSPVESEEIDFTNIYERIAPPVVVNPTVDDGTILRIRPDLNRHPSGLQPEAYPFEPRIRERARFWN